MFWPAETLGRRTILSTGTGRYCGISGTPSWSLPVVTQGASSVDRRYTDRSPMPKLSLAKLERHLYSTAGHLRQNCLNAVPRLERRAAAPWGRADRGNILLEQQQSPPDKLFKLG